MVICSLGYLTDHKLCWVVVVGLKRALTLYGPWNSQNVESRNNSGQRKQPNLKNNKRLHRWKVKRWFVVWLEKDEISAVLRIHWHSLWWLLPLKRGINAACFEFVRSVIPRIQLAEKKYEESWKLQKQFILESFSRNYLPSRKSGLTEWKRRKYFKETFLSHIFPGNS